ncbi:hypothetical protein [Shewanella woodyi]|uniref:Uncharacterized protein n=1 Tax=Shewanella woodyi (strain ATCC 51908 / MS32) TaxID=392500 RepID=B1KI14_SHEWM|nr:hypothetical protein [Shewanella woodyi]ACA85492.1 hypothetical protein Swoo_1199 [Shewanella woodyi ATCC 51908]
MEKSLLELLQRAALEFQGRELLILDIGIFPWHSSIELSLLFSDDQCARDDIAAWPHYDYSKFSEGGWCSAQPVAKQLACEWEKTSDIVGILKREAQVVNLPCIQEVLSSFKLAAEFRVQVLNSDDSHSPNYLYLGTE